MEMRKHSGTALVLVTVAVSFTGCLVYLPCHFKGVKQKLQILCDIPFEIKISLSLFYWSCRFVEIRPSVSIKKYHLFNILYLEHQYVYIKLFYHYIYTN